MIAWLVGPAVVASAVAAVPLLAFVALRRAPAVVQRELLVVALAVFLVVPLAALLAKPTAVMLPVEIAAAGASGTAGVFNEASVVADPAAHLEQPSLSASVASLPPSGYNIRLIDVIYFAISGLLWLRIGVGLLATAKQSHRSTDISADEVLRPALRHAAMAAQLRRTACPPAVTVPGLTTPMTVGGVRPVLCLPEDWRGWDAATLEAVLIHELTHIRQRDGVVLRSSLMLRALFWFNPLVWWLHRALVDAGERVSDEAVLDAGIDRTAYAELLLTFLRARGKYMAGIAMSGGRRPAVRITRVLAWQPRPRRASRSAVLASLIVVQFVAPAAASLRVELRAVDLPSWGPPAPILAAPKLAMPIDAGVARQESRVAPVAQTAGPRSAAGDPLDIQMQKSLEGHRLMMLALDLRALSGPVLDRATEAAERRILGAAGPNDEIGLLIPGTQVAIPITRNLASVRAAMTAAKGVRPTVLPFELDPAICASMRELQDTALAKFSVGMLSPREVPEELVLVYFSDDIVEPGEMRRRTASWTQSCREAGVQVILVDVDRVAFQGLPAPVPFAAYVSAYNAIGTRKTLGASVQDLASVPRLVVLSSRTASVPRASGLPLVLAPQAGLPAGVSSAKTQTDYGHAELTIRNIGQKEILGVTIGVLIDFQNQQPSRVQTSSLPPVRLVPGEAVTFQTRVIDADDLDEWAMRGAVVTAGVVAIEFADDTRWSYDLRSKGSFGK